MLDLIKFSDNKMITFICPMCHKTWRDGRIESDPDDTHYAIMSCGDCRYDDNDDDDDDPIIYYDKYNYMLKIDND